MKRWGLHVCPLDRDCRRYGAPPRVQITTPWRSIAFAFAPSGKFARGKHGSVWWEWWHSA